MLKLQKQICVNTSKCSCPWYLMSFTSWCHSVSPSLLCSFQLINPWSSWLHRVLYYILFDMVDWIVFLIFFHIFNLVHTNLAYVWLGYVSATLLYLFILLIIFLGSQGSWDMNLYWLLVKGNYTSSFPLSMPFFSTYCWLIWLVKTCILVCFSFLWKRF